jgi:pimeloyl-ACP methyl ester carboxylesterase
MPYLEFLGHQIWFEEQGAGEPLLFLHNGGNDHRIWDHQVSHFARTHRVIVVDHLGYGNSDKPDIDYTLPLYTREVELIVNELDLAPVVLIGHCIGGAMAVNYTLQHPEKVRALIVFNIATETTLCAGPLKDAYFGFRGNPEAREQFVAGFECRMTREQTDAALAQQFGPGAAIEPEFAAHIHELWNRPGQMRSLYRNLACFDSFASLDAAERPDRFPPFLAFWGAANAILPPEGARGLLARLRPDRVRMLERCGHLGMREKPAEVNHEIEDLLAALTVRAAASAPAG